MIYDLHCHLDLLPSMREFAKDAKENHKYRILGGIDKAFVRKQVNIIFQTYKAEPAASHFIVRERKA